MEAELFHELVKVELFAWQIAEWSNLRCCPHTKIQLQEEPLTLKRFISIITLLSGATVVRG